MPCTILGLPGPLQKGNVSCQSAYGRLADITFNRVPSAMLASSVILPHGVAPSNPFDVRSSPPNI